MDFFWEQLGGGIERLTDLLEPPQKPRGPCPKARLAAIDGTVRLAPLDKGICVTVQGGAAGGTQVLRVDSAADLLVQDGDQVMVGHALTRGSRHHRELRRVVGELRYSEHVARELERTFLQESQVVDLRIFDLLAREQARRLP